MLERINTKTAYSLVENRADLDPKGKTPTLSEPSISADVSRCVKGTKPVRLSSLAGLLGSHPIDHNHFPCPEAISGRENVSFLEACRVCLHFPHFGHFSPFDNSALGPAKFPISPQHVTTA